MSAAGPSPLRLALVVAALFLAGAASGFALRGWLPPPPHPPGRGPPWLRELDLTAEQRRAAEALFERHRADVDALMRETFPRVRARNEQLERELGALLTEPQRRQLEAIRARRPPFPPGGPGPGGPGDPPGGPGGPPPGLDGPPPPPPR